MSGRWQGSNRRSRLPSNWPTLRKQRLELDGYRCTWTTHGVRCTERATDVDHRIAMSDDNRLSELRSLCSAHHARKSAREGNAAYRAAIAKSKKKYRREPEKHPGLL